MPDTSLPQKACRLLLSSLRYCLLIGLLIAHGSTTFNHSGSSATKASESAVVSVTIALTDTSISAAMELANNHPSLDPTRVPIPIREGVYEFFLLEELEGDTAITLLRDDGFLVTPAGWP